MTTLSSNAVWLLTGLDAVLLAVLGAVLFTYMRGKRRDTAGLTELIRTIKENEPAQLEALRTALKEQYGQNDNDAAENAKKLTKTKKTFYKYLINAHLARDGEALASLDPRLDELLTAYRTLLPITAETPEQPAQEQAAAEDGAAESAQEDDARAELEELKRQNDELKQELEKTNRALDEALNEYASAYSGGAEAGKERLEHEKHKLHDQQGHPAHEEPAAPPAADPAVAQNSTVETQPGDAAADVTAQEPTDAADEAAQNPAETQNQDEIDQLMGDMPKFDSILVEEVDDSKPREPAVEEQPH